MEEKRKKIEEILTWVGGVSDFDIMEMAEQIRNGQYHFSGSLSRYELSSCIRDAITVYLEGEFDAAFVKLKKLMYLMSELYSHDSTPNGIREYASMLNGIAENMETCDRFLGEWKREAEFEVRNAFGLNTDKFSLNAYDCLSIKKSIDGRYFHLYKYKNGGSTRKTAKYKISNGILASDCLSNLITNTGCDDTWGITVGLYLERKIDLSYFVITFSLNGNVWVLTDRLIYENPDQIDRLRGGGRRFSEDRERNLDFLPYILIDKVIENRNNSNEVATQTGNEIWTFPLEEYFCENLYYVIKFTIEKIQSDYEVKNLIGVGDGALLLTEGHVDMSDDSHFQQTNIDILNGIVEEIYGGSSKALVIPNKSLVEQLGVSTELMTIDDIEKHTQYLAHKKVVDEHEKEKWGAFSEVDSGYEIYKEYERQKHIVLEMFKSKAKDFEKFLFAGDKVLIHDIDHPTLWGGFNAERSLRYNHPFVTNITEYGSVLGRTCLCGDGHEVKKKEYFKSFEFLRYTEIITILGIQRSELPPLFRDYISHYYLPYIGNQILDNVKPEFFGLESDYVSRREANGLTVSFPYCGFCNKRLYKKYKVSEEAVIVISSKKNSVLEIISKEEFTTKYDNQ